MSDLLKIQEVNFETALIEHLQALGYETLLGSDIDRQSEDFRGSSCIVVGKKIKQLHWKAVV